jgi:hypothetical protein
MSDRIATGVFAAAVAAIIGFGTGYGASYLHPGPAGRSGPPGPVLTIKGVFRFTTQDWTRLGTGPTGAGFNASTDGGDAFGAAQKLQGIHGFQWVSGFNKTTCTQQITDAALTSLVQQNVAAGFSGLIYEISDEPVDFGCTPAQAIPIYQHLGALIHAADPNPNTATFTTDAQFNQNPAAWAAGVRLYGAVDILGQVLYPFLAWDPVAHYDWIDQAKARMAAVPKQAWMPVMQDFGASSWRFPTLAELHAQFDRWTLTPPANMLGYWVFAWDYGPSLDIPAQGHEQFWQTANRLPRLSL